MHSVGVPVSDSPIAPSWSPQLGRRRGDGGDGYQCDEPNVVGMNRMTDTEAGLSVQTEGTMVRLPSQRSADRLPNISFSCSLFISIDRLDKHRSSLRHTYISPERNFSSHFSMASRGILSTLAVQKPSAGSTEPARAPSPLDPMTLREAEAACVTNCARDVERTRASRGPILPHHPLLLHLWWRPRRSLSRAAGSPLPMPTPSARRHSHSPLLVEYVASSAAEHSAQGTLARKDKRSLPIPVRVTKPVSPLLNMTRLVLLLAISPPESTPWVNLCLYVAHPLLGILHVHAESEFPNSNRVGFPFEPLVSVVVCHTIYLIRPGTSLSLGLFYAHPTYIEQPSLSQESFVNITMCFARLGPIAFTMQRYIWMQ